MQQFAPLRGACCCFQRLNLQLHRFPALKGFYRKREKADFSLRCYDPSYERDDFKVVPDTRDEKHNNDTIMAGLIWSLHQTYTIHMQRCIYLHTRHRSYSYDLVDTLLGPRSLTQPHSPGTVSLETWSVNALALVCPSTWTLAWHHMHLHYWNNYVVIPCTVV